MDHMNAVTQTESSCKRSSLLQRRADLSSESFRDHWAGPHAAIARTMPGIARYTQNRTSERIWMAAPDRTFDSDGIVELEFRNERAMMEANAGDAVQKLLPEDELCFLDGITLCRVPGGARQIWPGMMKVMVAACLEDPADSTAERLHEMLATTGCIASSIDTVCGSSHRSRLRYESDPPHFFATLWFAAQDDPRARFGDGSPWVRAARTRVRRGAAWLCDPLAVVS